MTTQKIIATPRADARQILRDTDGRFFSCLFIKKDGTPRVMNARTGVRAGVKGVGLSFNPQDHGLLTVRDVQKNAFRMINLNTILTATVKGQTHVFY